MVYYISLLLVLSFTSATTLGAAAQATTACAKVHCSFDNKPGIQAFVYQGNYNGQYYVVSGNIRKPRFKAKVAHGLYGYENIDDIKTILSIYATLARAYHYPYSIPQEQQAVLDKTMKLAGLI